MHPIVDEKDRKGDLERIVPGTADDPELLAMHTARYEFATSHVRNKVVVDIACGVGYGSAMMAKGSPRKTVGIDISHNAVEYARRHFAASGVEFYRGSTELLGSVGPIDLVVSFETIEHIHEYDGFLSHVAANLKAEGKLIISTPLRQNGTFTDKPANPFHVQEWNEQEFDLLLSRYFNRREIFWQFVYKKSWYPGSRRISWIVGRILYPASFRTLEKYEVTRKPPQMPGVPIVAGFIIEVCSNPAPQKDRKA